MVPLWSLMALCALAQEPAPAWAPVEVQAEGADLRLHLVHRNVLERVSVGDEVWELLESGIVARRGPDGALLGHFLDCRVSDLVGDLRLCEDGRVLSPTGEVGRFARYPSRATPWQDGLVAAVSVPEGVAIQRLGRDPVLVRDPAEGYPSDLLAYEGQLYAGWDRQVLRIDPDTGETEIVLFPHHRAERLVVEEGRLVVQGMWAHGDYGYYVQQVVPKDPAELVEAHDVPPQDLPRIPSLEPAPGPEIPGELVWGYREVHQTRWGLFAQGIAGYGMGPELFGVEGWKELSEDDTWVPGLGGELYALRGSVGGVSVHRWNGAALDEQTRIANIHRSGLFLGLDELFMGPDGRWWLLDLEDGRAFAWAGSRWVGLGHALPVNGLAVRALDGQHLYARVEGQLWRWSPTGFELLADGVLAESTPQGVLTWDGRALRRGDELLLEDSSLKIARIAQDGCGRIWLMGQQVVVLEGGRAVPVTHPLLEGTSWAYGDATGEGAILSDGRMVVEVARACPGAR